MLETVAKLLMSIDIVIFSVNLVRFIGRIDCPAVHDIRELVGFDDGGLFIGVDVLQDDSATVIVLVAFEHPILQAFHRRVVATSHAAPVFTFFATTATLVLAWVEMGSTKMCRRIVVCTIGLAVATSLAAGEESVVGRYVATYPHATY